MSKPFETALQEWKDDKRYSIGEDVGAEYYDYLECPTHSDRSLADSWPKDSNTKDPQ